MREERLNELSNQLTKQGKLAEAEAVLRRHGPDFAATAEFRGRLSNLLALQGKTAELEAFLRSCVKRDPRSPEARDALVGFLMRHDRLLEAARVLGPASAPLASELSRRMKEQARTFIATDRCAEAGPLIRGLLASSPRDFDALFLKARSLRRQDRLDAAAGAFRRAARVEPRRMRTYLHWAEALSWRPGGRAASALLRGALDSCPPPKSGDVAELTDRCLAALYAFDFVEAAALGEKVLDLTRDYAALRALGWVCLVYEFRTEQAFGPVEAILRRLNAYRAAHPRCPWGHYWMLYFSSRGVRAMNPSRLSATIRALGAFGKRYAWMRYEIGKWRFAARDFRGAARDFRAALPSSDPPNWRAQCHYAETLWCLGERVRALEAFRIAEELAPADDVDGMRVWKGEVLLWGGEYAAALELVRLARSVRGAQPSEGAALFKLGRALPALDALDRTIARNPSCVEARLWRAEVLLSLNRLEEASSELAAAARRKNFYFRVLGGLVHGARGNEARAAADYRAVPARIRAWAKKKAGLSGKETAAERRTILETILALSRGVRSEALLYYWLPAKG
jgi:tetratricopeptide (TPR) repeat protein